MIRALLVAVALAAPHAAVPARLGVSAKEFSFTLSRLTLKAGPAIVELANYGEDAHDLHLRRVGSKQTLAIGVVQPGEVADLETKLAPGKYVLWCGVADHAQRGMRATLTVKRR